MVFETNLVSPLISSAVKVYPPEKIPHIVMFHLLNKSGQIQRKEEQLILATRRVCVSKINGP